jgi:RHS repeat-associated protein
MSIAAATRRDSLPRPPETDSVGFVILLADHDEPLLAAKKKQRRSASSTPTSTPKNRVWGFDDDSLGRPCSGHELSWETAIGSVQYSYENASGRANYYTRDHLGSVREMLNSSGTIVARYSYDPYGRTTLVSGTNLATKQYANYYVHAASGLYLTKYRAFDPATGRWLSRDPIGEDGGLNLYGYVSNDPEEFSDILGLECEAQAAAVERAKLGAQSADLGVQIANTQLTIALLKYDMATTAIQKGSAVEQIEAARQDIEHASATKEGALTNLAAAQAAYILCMAMKGTKGPEDVCPKPLPEVPPYLRIFGPVAGAIYLLQLELEQDPLFNGGHVPNA